MAGIRSPLTNVVNFALAQAGWFACVIGAARGTPWLGPAVAAAIVAFHLARARSRRAEWRLLAVVAAIGLVLDGWLKGTGLVAYAADTVSLRWVAPMWIVALWVLFATTLNQSMIWLRGRSVIAALLGAIFGPLSYLSGARLGAASFPNGKTAALVALAAAWAAVIPLLSRLAATLSGAGRSAGGTSAC